LYAARSSGYGLASTPLLPTSGPGVIMTNSGGSFGITNDYTCPSSGAQVYIVATGGNSGSGTNANLALMAALGSCGNLSGSTYISMNELTTVGSVYALAPFMTGIANVGSSSANTAGLANAFADVNTLTNTGTGAVPGAAAPTGATVPVAELNTLADILASCINSSGGTGAQTNCGMLFAAATPAGGTAPTDTVTAAMDIAQNPGHNVNALYVLSGATPPFQPTLTTTPNDFTVAVNYTGGSFSAPSALAADASGNIWITNATGNTVTELAHSGVVLSGTGYTASLNTPSAIAIAADSTVWVTNQGNSTVSRLTSAGAAYSGAPYSGGGLSAPKSIAFDSLGNGWIANSGNASVTEVNSAGSVLTNYTPAGGTSPLAVAVNPH